MSARKINGDWRTFGAFLVLVLAFALGRASAPSVPARVEVREVEIERVVEVEVERVVEVKVREQVEARRVVVYRDRVVLPDGTQREREIETSVTGTSARESAESETVRTEARETVREVERVVEVEAARPAWRVGALVGLDVPRLQPTFGATVERRILGPVSVGAWGLSTGAGGLSLSVEF